MSAGGVRSIPMPHEETKSLRGCVWATHLMGTAVLQRRVGSPGLVCPQTIAGVRAGGVASGDLTTEFPQQFWAAAAACAHHEHPPVHLLARLAAAAGASCCRTPRLHTAGAGGAARAAHAACSSPALACRPIRGQPRCPGSASAAACCASLIQTCRCRCLRAVPPPAVATATTQQHNCCYVRMPTATAVHTLQHGSRAPPAPAMPAQCPDIC